MLNPKGAGLPHRQIHQQVRPLPKLYLLLFLLRGVGKN